MQKYVKQYFSFFSNFIIFKLLVISNHLQKFFTTYFTQYLFDEKINNLSPRGITIHEYDTNAISFKGNMIFSFRRLNIAHELLRR